LIDSFLFHFFVFVFYLFFSSFIAFFFNNKQKKMLGRSAAEGDPDCTEVLEDNSRSILMGIISQLRKDMDLSKVTLPTFVLEPRSMLERVTDFMAHPEFLIE
jgi:hypothetical protein